MKVLRFQPPADQHRAEGVYRVLLENLDALYGTARLFIPETVMLTLAAAGIVLERARRRNQPATAAGREASPRVS